VAEELKHPARTLPLSLAYGTALVAALFIGLNVLFIYAVPLESMKGVVAVGALAAQHLFGPAVAGIFSAAMALSLLATVNAEVTIGPRVYYAMAKNGAFFSMAAKVDPRWHTPVIAILCQGVCAILMTVSPFLNLLLYIGLLLNFFAVLSVGSLFIFRRARVGRNWRSEFRLSAAAGVFRGGGSVWMTILGVMLRPGISAIAVLTVAAGAAVYHFKLRIRDGVNSPAPAAIPAAPAPRDGSASSCGARCRPDETTQSPRSGSEPAVPAPPLLPSRARA
jgi:APA family basic amino acid/polyamine antiporter